MAELQRVVDPNLTLAREYASRPINGRETTTSDGCAPQPSAARTEMGVNAESTAQIQTMKRRRLQGETPRPRRSRSAVLPKSKANWATRASA